MIPGPSPDFSPAEVEISAKLKALLYSRRSPAPVPSATGTKVDSESALAMSTRADGQRERAKGKATNVSDDLPV